MKNLYENPVVEMVLIDTLDVLTTSCEDNFMNFSDIIFN